MSMTADNSSFRDEENSDVSDCSQLIFQDEKNSDVSDCSQLILPG
jgi:hypothetical protein